MRTCSVCSLTKEESLFTKQGKYYRNICKSCTSERVKDYWKNNPDKYLENVDSRRAHKRHGLTTDEYIKMLDKYDGLCYACREEEAVCIDHDHNCCPGNWSCGKCIRGILCMHCNWALGHIKDRIDRAEKLIEYLAL